MFELLKSLLLRFSAPGKQIPPVVFTTFWHKVREIPKVLGEKKTVTLY